MSESSSAVKENLQSGAKSRLPNSQQNKQINALKAKLNQLLKLKGKDTALASGGGGGQKTQKEKNGKFACWHCGSKKHAVASCPVAKAGKPPTKGSLLLLEKASEGRRSPRVKGVPPCNVAEYEGLQSNESRRCEGGSR